MKIFEQLESNVRSYSRAWPTVFKHAQGAILTNTNGVEYIDFFSGAGTLNYGHNNPEMKKKLIEYIETDGVIHSLDMSTTAKQLFLERFESIILKPRNLDYKVQFPGPTGTNSVEAALKLARKITGREPIYGFTNAFHGMTLGAMAVSGSPKRREAAGVLPNDIPPLPYDDPELDSTQTIEKIETIIQNSQQLGKMPAAIIVETIQGEGGLHTASNIWLQRLVKVCNDHEVLVIVDDVQAGCGRTGTFFSFEPAKIVPDIVCVSKSISGYGLPLALTLFKRDLDIWEPGEHSGTFRGNNPAFVTGAEALNFWENSEFSTEVKNKTDKISNFLITLTLENEAAQATPRGRGFFQGIHIAIPGLAESVCKIAFQKGLLMETSGVQSDVVKLLPPLTISEKILKQGLNILQESLLIALADKRREN